MGHFLRDILFFIHRMIRGIGNRLLDKHLLHSRPFSNHMLRVYASLFIGNVINVSGWDDRDSQGGFYHDYFKNCSHYVVSNAPIEHKGIGSMTGKDIEEIEIDLAKPLPAALQRKFDVVFNHTTIEHILDIEMAFKNICELSRDAVIIVVPVIQNIHIAKDCGDYWRLTTLGIAKMFLKHGFEPMVIVCNDQPFAPVYCFAIGVREPKKYEGKIDKKLEFEMGRFLYGSSLKNSCLEVLLKKE